MLPFSVRFKPGIPVYRQVVYAVKKAIVSGQLLPGDPFPSVRVLAQELRINPNTAHRVVTALVRERLLDVRLGSGTLVSERRPADRRERRELLGEEVERLVVEAKRLDLDMHDIVQALRKHWNKLARNK